MQKWISIVKANLNSCRGCQLIYQKSLGGVSVIHLLFFFLQSNTSFLFILLLRNTLEFSGCSLVGYWFIFYEFFKFFWGVKGFKAIAGDLALGVQTQQLWAFQPLQSSQHLNLGITNLVDKAANPFNKEGLQLLSTQCARYSVELTAEEWGVTQHKVP